MDRLRMVEAFGGVATDPRGITLHGVPHKVNAGEAAWEFLSGFSWYRKRVPGPVGVLRDLDVLQATIEDVRLEIVRDMRGEGISWNEIGEALGVTRQAARQRYGGAGIK